MGVWRELYGRSPSNRKIQTLKKTKKKTERNEENSRKAIA
jgi:hypothetical protein